MELQEADQFCEVGSWVGGWVEQVHFPPLLLLFLSYIEDQLLCPAPHFNRLVLLYLTNHPSTTPKNCRYYYELIKTPMDLPHPPTHPPNPYVQHLIPTASFSSTFSSIHPPTQKQPVGRREYPDYYELIKTPMDFTTLLSRVRRHMYADLPTFLKDLGKQPTHPPTHSPYRAHLHQLPRLL